MSRRLLQLRHNDVTCNPMSPERKWSPDLAQVLVNVKHPGKRASFARAVHACIKILHRDPKLSISTSFFLLLWHCSSTLAIHHRRLRQAQSTQHTKSAPLRSPNGLRLAISIARCYSSPVFAPVLYQSKSLRRSRRSTQAHCLVGLHIGRSVSKGFAADHVRVHDLTWLLPQAHPSAHEMRHASRC